MCLGWLVEHRTSDLQVDDGLRRPEAVGRGAHVLADVFLSERRDREDSALNLVVVRQPSGPVYMQIHTSTVNAAVITSKQVQGLEIRPRLLSTVLSSKLAKQGPEAVLSKF